MRKVCFFAITFDGAYLSRLALESPESAVSVRDPSSSSTCLFGHPPPPGQRVPSLPRCGTTVDLWGRLPTGPAPEPRILRVPREDALRGPSRARASSPWELSFSLCYRRSKTPALYSCSPTALFGIIPKYHSVWLRATLLSGVPLRPVRTEATAAAAPWCCRPRTRTASRACISAPPREPPAA